MACTGARTSSAGRTGRAAAVLLRAGEVIAGADVAAARRPAARRERDLARGPARLAACLGLGAAHNGLDLCDEHSDGRPGQHAGAGRRP